MLMRQARSRRPQRSLASDWISGGPARFEPRFLTTLFFLRTSPANICSWIIDPMPTGGPWFVSFNQLGQANGSAGWTAYNNGGIAGAPGEARNIYAGITHAVIDDPVNGTLETVEVLANHTDQGMLTNYASGPAALDGFPTYNSAAWTNGPLTWNISDTVSSSLPPTLSVFYHFTAKYSALNPDNMAGPGLVLQSTFVNVNIAPNAVVNPGLIVTDAATGTVLYNDPNFGATPNDTADVHFLTTVATGGGATLPVFVNYASNLLTPPLANQGPGNPDTTWYQDHFDWTLTFAVY